jgi:hypothetical protein
VLSWCDLSSSLSTPRSHYWGKTEHTRHYIFKKRSRNKQNKKKIKNKERKKRKSRSIPCLFFKEPGFHMQNPYDFNTAHMRLPPRTHKWTKIQRFVNLSITRELFVAFWLRLTYLDHQCTWTYNVEYFLRSVFLILEIKADKKHTKINFLRRISN